MSAESHPILGGLFLAGAVFAIGTMAVEGIEGGRARAEAERRAELVRGVSDAVLEGQDGNLVEAERRLAGLAAAHPRDPDVLYNLAVAQGGLGKLEEADRTLKTVLELRPTDVDAIGERAAVLAQLGRLDESVELLRRVAPKHAGLGLRLAEDPRFTEREDPRFAELRRQHE